MLYRLKCVVEYLKMILGALREIKKLQDEIFDEKGLIK